MARYRDVVAHVTIRTDPVQSFSSTFESWQEWLAHVLINALGPDASVTITSGSGWKLSNLGPQEGEGD